MHECTGYIDLHGCSSCHALIGSSYTIGSKMYVLSRNPSLNGIGTVADLILPTKPFATDSCSFVGQVVGNVTPYLKVNWSKYYTQRNVIKLNLTKKGDKTNQTLTGLFSSYAHSIYSTYI